MFLIEGRPRPVEGKTDRRVAELKLADWGIEIDHLTEDQKVYLYGD